MVHTDEQKCPIEIKSFLGREDFLLIHGHFSGQLAPYISTLHDLNRAHSHLLLTMVRDDDWSIRRYRETTLSMPVRDLLAQAEHKLKPDDTKRVSMARGNATVSVGNVF